MKPYIKKIMPFIIFQLAANFICTILASMYPYMQKQLFDSGQKLNVILWYAIFHILDVFINYISMRATFSGAIHLEKNMKHDFFKSIMRRSKKQFSERAIGTYLSWQSNDLSAIEMDYLQPAIDIIRSINMFLIYGVVIFGLVDWRIGTALFLSSAVTIFGPKIFGNLMGTARNIHQEKIAEYTNMVKDLLEGFSLVNSRTKKQYIHTQDKKLEEMCQKREEYGKAKSASIAVNDMAVRIIQITSFAAAGILFAKGQITIGTCVATFGYVDSFLSPINSILHDVSAIQSVTKVKKKIIGFINQKDVKKKDVINTFSKEIRLDNVSVSYESFSMENLSCVFEKGKKYALIGHSGSGKSTIINLLMGDLQAQDGDVTIDGKALHQFDTAGLISCIRQNEHIFHAGYKDNVTVFGSYSDEMLKELEMLLENRVLNTVITKSTKNCQELSGGERQTLIFLRLLLEQTEVVLMDEPFSAVDQQTTGLYMDYLMKKMNPDTTLILVTHDLSDRLSEFDEVLLMADGQVKKKGKYEEIRKYI